MIIKNWLAKAKFKIIDNYNANNSVKEDIYNINLKRMLYCSILALPLSLFLIILYSYRLKGLSDIEYTWQLSIVISNSIIFIFMGALAIISYILIKRKTINFTAKILPLIGVSFLLLAGIATTVLDQLVITNITPIIMTIAIVSLAFYLRPYMAVILFILTFIAFYFSIAITQDNPTELLSIRANFFSIIFIAIGLTYILWKSKVTSILYKKQIEHLAYYDQMTLLYNRYSFQELLIKEKESIEKNNHSSCLIIMDLDNFKVINDKYGHPNGDKLIVNLARLLIDNLDKEYKISRWGGDEFLILLPETTLEQARIIAEKIRIIVSQYDLILNGDSIAITSSFGVLDLNTNNIDLEKAYKKVDEALYLAKEKGKNRVELV